MSGSTRLLVVDDEAAHRRFVSSVLAPAGWVIDESESGEAALNAVENERYALVLLDIHMQGLDGFDTARAIRESGTGSANLAILAFTSLPFAQIKRQIQDSGMDGYLAKPCSPEQLTLATCPWMPDATASTRDRLSTLFGAEEFAALVAGFYGQLRDAVAHIDEPNGASRAHRIGGLAGTLGFIEVSKAWIALSEGNESSRDMARVSARKALLAIDREVSIRSPY
jgi:two-component system OmpR family response regulator